MYSQNIETIDLTMENNIIKIIMIGSPPGGGLSVRGEGAGGGAWCPPRFPGNFSPPASGRGFGDGTQGSAIQIDHIKNI